MKQWYESLFENYGQKYDRESFAQGTLGECDFIEQEMNRDKSLKVIDIGCGTGRHAIELTLGFNKIDIFGAKLGAFTAVSYTHLTLPTILRV